MPFAEDDPRLKFVPLEEAEIPKGHFCKVYYKKWWSYCRGRGIIFYRTNLKKDWWTPQCNSNEEEAKLVTTKLYPWAKTIFVPLVFDKLDLDEYKD